MSNFLNTTPKVRGQADTKFTKEGRFFLVPLVLFVVNVSRKYANPGG